ncbi:MAG: hypothetical protein GXP41_02835 [Chloroflexi bacterium]|nr:hypothetical protein [Chloroflexota bacterium]
MFRRYQSLAIALLAGFAVTVLLLQVVVAAIPVENAFGQATVASHRARQNPIVKIEPASRTVGTGDTFTTAVAIQNSSDLGGFEFALSYNRNVLTVTGAMLDSFLGSTGRQTIPLGPLYTDTSPITSSVIFGGISFSPDGFGGANGSGSLTVLTLTANAPGSTALQLSGVKLTDTKATPQPVTHEDGLMTVVGAATSTPTPTVVGTIPPPSATPVSRLFLPLVMK